MENYSAVFEAYDALAVALKKNTTLIKLIIYAGVNENPPPVKCEGDSAVAMLEALQRNTTLKSFFCDLITTGMLDSFSLSEKLQRRGWSRSASSTIPLLNSAERVIPQLAGTRFATGSVISIGRPLSTAITSRGTFLRGRCKKLFQSFWRIAWNGEL